MPELLLIGTTPSGQEAARLCAMIRGERTGVGVVLAGEWQEAGCTLHLTSGGHTTVPGFSGTVVANGLDDEVLQVLVSLLAKAEQPVMAAAPLEHPAPSSGRIVDDQSEADDDLAEEAAETVRPVDELDAAVAAWFDESRTDVVRVKIMGRVRVEAPGPIEPNRVTVCTELVAYMATHGRVVENPAQFDLALWPARAVLAKTRTQAIVRARGWLGDDENGEPRLSKGHGGELRLAPTVLVDWDLFQQLAHRGLTRGESGAADLATALRFVRGKPFEDVPAQRYAWVAETFLEQDIPVAVVDVSHRLAELMRLAGDLAGARDAARRAQLADRYDERPWRDLLETEHALGNTSAVRALVSELMTTLELEVDEELDPETNDLISRVLPRRRAAS